MLADKLFELQSYKRQYEALLIISVSGMITSLEWKYNKIELLEKIDWNNMLGIASVLSYSEKNEHLDSALRIAQTCIEENSTNIAQKKAAGIILENLTNKPAIDLAIKRNLINSEYKENIPLPFILQTIKTKIENSAIVNNKVIGLNKFQKNVFNSYVENDTISISAPTSAGKSFILYQIILEEISKRSKLHIAYIVPTRALISQVENDLRELLKNNEILNANVSTVPQVENKLDGPSIFIFTQERLHWYLIEAQASIIDILIIDEAQKIDDGNRGILLQQKIEEIVNSNPNLKVYFSSPFTSNPELLLENIKNNSKKDKVNTQFVAVNQNLIYINQVPRKVEVWEVSLCFSEKIIPIGNINLKDRPNSELKKLCFISESFSTGKPGNIIYSNGAAEAEEISLILYDLISPKIISNNVKEFIQLIKKTVHKEYTLVKVLEKGIAFHYGNIPIIIRQEIERLFNDGEIDYLICTSTLLEGVNLPAKSVFIKKPTRGRGKPLQPNDFWNLAGRAGRWGKEFSGNIVCIEPKTWDIPPEPNKSKQTIKRALDEIKNNYAQEFIDYIQNNTPRDVAEKRQDMESAFGYYYIKYLKNDLYSDNDFTLALVKLFENLKDKIVIPDYIIQRNPGISPIAQQSLLDFFYTKLGEMESLLPAYPEDANAVDEYINLIGRIGKTISNYPDQLNFSRAILLVNWMRGRPLSYLISSSFDYYQRKKKQEKKLPVVIRETMDNVENFVRFRFAKDSSCYVDILRYFYEIHSRLDLIRKIPQLNLWLEFGVSQKTHISLLALGLTRSSVIELSGYITNSQMTKEECLQWIKEQNLNQLELSKIIIADVKKIL